MNTERPASEAQISYLRTLLAERIEDAAAAENAVAWLDSSRITMELASAKITKYANMPKIRRAVTRGHANEDVEVGLYRVDGVAYKVKRAVYGSGFLYACPWSEALQGFGEKEPGAIRKIHASHRMTAEEAGAYGLAMSACAHCGRDLTDEESIARGLGPICAGKYN